MPSHSGRVTDGRFFFVTTTPNAAVLVLPSQSMGTPTLDLHDSVPGTSVKALQLIRL
jgi:hypothetical protein